MRINPDSGFSAPVQCFVGSAVSVSLIDQMLKYGSCAISGVAGGRSGAGVCAQTKRARSKIVKAKKPARLYMVIGSSSSVRIFNTKGQRGQRDKGPKKNYNLSFSTLTLCPFDPLC